MTTTTRENTETSVAISLVELARIEEDRVREEDERRARAREKESRERRTAEAQRRAEEEKRIVAQEEARARRQREEAEEQMRAKAREQAAIEVARIEAEGKARIEAENAARAHELAVLRVRSESRGRSLKIALGAALGLVLLGGPVAVYSMNRQVTGLEQELGQLRESHAALSQERDQARTTELAALDRRLAELSRRPILKTDPRAVEEAQATVEAARKAVDTRSVDHSRLRAFGEALDALEARIEGLEKLAALDRRMADLDAWADQRHKEGASGAARTAASRARAHTDEGALRTYEMALDVLRDALAKDGGRGGVAGTVAGKSGNCTDPNDPMCGFNGQSL
jgi:hypothetical protein